MNVGRDGIRGTVTAPRQTVAVVLVQAAMYVVPSMEAYRRGKRPTGATSMAGPFIDSLRAR